VAVIALVALNRSFYGLIARRRGAPQAAAGVGLHALHHAVGVASVPFGLLDPRYRDPTSDGGGALG
jgi:hypothetical protein